MPEDRSSWFDAWLDAGRRGDQAEYDRLFVHSQGMIRRSVEKQMSRRLRKRVSPEDVAQEIQMIVYREAPKARFENLRAFRGWVEELVRNRLIDHERKEFGPKRGTDPQSLEKTLPGGGSAPGWLRDAIPGSQSTPSREASKREDINGVPALLGKLPEDLREILRMAHFEGLTHAQIAARTGKSPEAVRKAISRAYEACRRLLGPGKGFPGGVSGT
ncbi:MAG TPA: sigma-70 family RNA polymerase sigma factor [Planctomycetota bacterium]|nr:sigma-70 family RNA polymerase sigma factor [Planctomycetota bacterium]